MSWLIKTYGILAFLVCSAFGGCRPLFRMYESTGFGNDYVENAFEYVARGDEPDLKIRGIGTGTRTNTCPLGLWMGYEYDRFQGGTTFYSEKNSNVHDCKFQSGPDYYASIRVVGHPDDFTASSVVTYINRFNEWGDTTYFEDTEQLSSPAIGSMIITGNVEIELFRESNFQGESVCFGPNNGRIYSLWDFQEKNHLRNGTELYTNMQYMEQVFDNLQFNSLRFGCGDNWQKK